VINDFVDLSLPENFKPEIKALLKRGNVTWDEYNALRMNTWEFHAIYLKLTDDALDQVVRHNLNNCGPGYYRTPTTYPETLQAILVPELLKRLAAYDKELENCRGWVCDLDSYRQDEGMEECPVCDEIEHAPDCKLGCMIKAFANG